MALERVPADIRRDGGVARMSDPILIKGIQEAVTIPVMAKARIGHFVEAQVLEALEVDYVDESEVLTPADEANHIDKWAFKVPFVCGATNLGEALRRIAEGAAMIRSKGEAGTGDIVEAVRHMRKISGEIKRISVARRLRARHRRQGAAGAAGPRAQRRQGRQAAGRPVLRRRHRHPGRRRADDAARRRGQLRRLRHLQVRGSGHARRRRSSRRPPTSRTPSGSPARPRASARPCSRWRRASSRSSSSSPTGAGNRRGAARRRARAAGRLRGPRPAPARARRRAARGARAGATSRGSTGS